MSMQYQVPSVSLRAEKMASSPAKICKRFTDSINICTAKHSSDRSIRKFRIFKEGFARGPYVSARVGFDPATFHCQKVKWRTPAYSIFTNAMSILIYEWIITSHYRRSRTFGRRRLCKRNPWRRAVIKFICYYRNTLFSSIQLLF